MTVQVQYASHLQDVHLNSKGCTSFVASFAAITAFSKTSMVAGEASGGAAGVLAAGPRQPPRAAGAPLSRRLVLQVPLRQIS